MLDLVLLVWIVVVPAVVIGASMLGARRRERIVAGAGAISIAAIPMLGRPARAHRPINRRPLCAATGARSTRPTGRGGAGRTEQS
jgi:hypothetical protein